MGSVYAKERPRPQMVKVPAENAPVLDFNKDVRVDKININGLGKTKNDIILPIVKELFQATNFGEVLVKADRVYRRLENLECFRNIEILVDTSKGPKASEDGLEVTFNVKELKWLLGSVNAMTGNDEGSLVIGARLPNVMGRAEKIQAEYSYGSKQTTNIGISFSKPVHSRADTMFKTTAFQGNSILTSSGYKEVGRGCTVELEFNSAPQVRHTLQWEGVWRNLSCLSRTVPFEVREQSGHSLKSSLIHSICMDRRKGNIFPTSGNLFELKSEFAGVGGDVGFLKNEIKIQSNLSLFKDFVLQGSLQGGVMNEFHNDKRVYICDRFFLGGPTSVRGFDSRGAGPHSDHCALGSEMYWAAGLHLYAPLPFRVFEKSFGELFRSHLFVNTGNIGKFDSGRDYREFFRQLMSNARLSAGAGIAIRLGQSARVELNFCLPMSAQQGDRPIRGFQIGVGMHFL